MKYFYCLLFLSLTYTVAVAQQEMTLQLMNNVFQSTHTNPAITPRNKVNITLLSSYQLGVTNTGFSYNQLLAQVETTETGDRVLNLESLLRQRKLNGRNYINAGGSVDLFALGFKAGKNRFSLNITEHFQGRLYYNNALLRTYVYGNTPGETIDLSGYSLYAMHYREIGLGYNRKLLEDNKLVVGGRLKMLHGMSNVHTRKSEVTIHTGTEEQLYEITGKADILVHTAGLNLLEEGESSYFLNRKNTGFGVDLGSTYRLDQKWSFAASVINLGFIRWKNDANSYRSQGSFTFRGIDNDSLFTSGKFNMDVTQLTDSITKTFEFKEDTKAYSTGLPTQLYLTSFYQLRPRTTASATLYTDFIGAGAFRRALALGIRQNVGKWLQVSTTYSLQAKAYNNLGFGFSLTSGGGGLQIYAVSDNIVGALNPGSARMTNVRTGFNFVF